MRLHQRSHQAPARGRETLRGHLQRRLAGGLAVVGALGLGGCYIDTQRYPGILKPITKPLPDGAKATFARGPEEALVIRHSDLVSVRIAETMSTIELRWYDKGARVPSGSWVYSGPQGFAEVLLPGATKVMMRGNCAGVVGSESRREPIFTFMQVADATVTFGEIGQVQLPGGALLEADNGLFGIKGLRDDLIRVSNRSGRKGTISYREELIVLDPSDSIDLALLDVGTAPFELDPDSRTVLSDGGRIELRGDIDVLASREGARLRAAGPNDITAYGLVIRLDVGDEILFEGLGSPEERRALAEENMRREVGENGEEGGQ